MYETNKLKLMEWSLNLSSSRDKKVSDFVIPTIINGLDEERKPDVVFLMESVKENSKWQEQVKELKKYYNIFESYNFKGNSIMIAVRNNIAVDGVVGKIPGVAFNNSPNFLHVIIKIHGVKYNLIGVRIKIGTRKSKNDLKADTLRKNEQDYKDRKKQFDIFNNYLSDIENAIVMGDFNNPRILGDEEADYNTNVEDIYWGNAEWDGKKEIKLSRFYNYQMIRSCLDEGFKLITPKGEQGSIGRINKKVLKSYEDSKLDHLIVSRDIRILESKLVYEWKPIKDNLGKYKFNERGEVEKGYPDHAILYAEIDLESK